MNFIIQKKGREVDHYKISNKFIIIAPQETPNLAKKN